MEIDSYKISIYYSSDIEKIVEQNINKEQYEDYYNAVIEKYDIVPYGLNRIEHQYRLLSFLPDDFQNIKEIKGVYNLVIDNNSSYDNKDFLDAISDYCSYYQISEYLVAENNFRVGEWSDSDGYYIYFDHNSHCEYSIPAPSNEYHYDYYRIVDGKYNLYVEGDENNNIDVFKMTLKSKNEIA